MKNFRLRLKNYLRRNVSKKTFQKIGRLISEEPIVTFTFDDFPRSAYLAGGAILGAYDYKATYYTSLGLMGKELPVGKGFLLEDMLELKEKGNELGCHTYGHYAAWGTDRDTFRKSIKKNAEKMSELIPSHSFTAFSYPKTNPSPFNKRIAGEIYKSCRGGGQSYNSGKIDLNLVKSYFIDKRNNQDTAELKGLIDKTNNANGWLVISTHDIRETPSDFGCDTEYFKEIVAYISNKNIQVMKMSEVVERCCKC